MEVMQSYPASPAEQLSHDLRIPLSSIMGVVDLLRCGNLSLEQKNYLGLIEVAAKRLLSLEGKLHTLLRCNE